MAVNRDGGLTRGVEGTWPGQGSRPPPDALERDRRVRAHRRWADRRRGGTDDRHDRCALPESEPRGVEPAGTNGGQGHPIGRARCGRNTTPLSVIAMIYLGLLSLQSGSVAWASR